MVRPGHIEAGLVAALRAAQTSARPTIGDVRREIGCSMAELKQAIERMRMQGKLHWDRLELSPSMLIACSAAEASSRPSAETSGARPEGAGGDAVAAAAPPPAAPCCLSLLEEVEAYCARTGLARTRFGYLCVKDYNFVSRLTSRTPRAATVEKVRAFMAAHPDGPPNSGGKHRGRSMVGGNRRQDARVISADVPPAATLRDEVRHEAEQLVARRRLAQSTGSVKTPLPIRELGPLSAIEEIQTRMAAEPSDLIKAVNRQHPEIWKRVVQLGRALEISPASALYRALECGLDVIKADLMEEAD